MLWSKRHTVMIFIAIAAIYGCQPPNYEKSYFETQAKVEEAKRQAETAKALDVEGRYDIVVQQAQTEALNAETKLNLRKLNEAYESAMVSLQASDQVFRQFYLDRIAKLAEQSKEASQVEIEKDTDTPLKDMLPELDRIIEYAGQLEDGQVDISADALHTDLALTAQTDTIIETIAKGKLESDFSFEPGKFELSEQGSIYLQALAEKMIVRIQELQRDYPDKTIVISIKVVSYTDEQPFRQGTKLVAALTEGFENNVPTGAIAQRRFLNQRLSQFRAQIVADDFRQFLMNSNILSSNVMIDETVVGMGEEIPQGISAPYPQNDPRRRICKIYSYAIAK